MTYITADTRHREHRAYKQGSKLDNEGHRLGTNELMMIMKREQETDHKWAREEGKHKTWGQSSDSRWLCKKQQKQVLCPKAFIA